MDETVYYYKETRTLHKKELDVYYALSYDGADRLSWELRPFHFSEDYLSDFTKMNLDEVLKLIKKKFDFYHQDAFPILIAEQIRKTRLGGLLI